MAIGLTKREYFGNLLDLAEVQADPHLVEFIEHELELLDRKNSSRSNKPTKAQLENATIADEIVAEWEQGKAYKVTDIVNTFEACTKRELTAQKVTAILGKLVNTGRVIRNVEKKTPLYKLA